MKLPYEARTKDGRKIGEFGGKESAERYAKQYGGYTTHERDRKNFKEIMGDARFSK